jgi:L-ascorbate metabolism protein UlaG (beta-lactamase superfamily)
MARAILRTTKRWAIRSLRIIVSIAIAAALLLALLWQDRPSLDDIDWSPYPEFETTTDRVTATWLGVSTILFDDGETQILIDGFFSRPTLAELVLGTPVRSDAANINLVLERYRMRRLAAIIPAHSHFDHAMDIGAVANRSSASILGSESTANIARGAGVPEDQIVVVGDTREYSFGRFTVRMIDSVHAPIAWGGSVPYAGTVDHPLPLPAPPSAWREGGSYSVVVQHPLGTALVQGSAGFIAGALDNVHADVVLLGVQLLEGLGKSYAERYWQAVVTTTGAKHVLPIHFEDFTQPFGEIKLLPRFIENVVDVAAWLEEFRDSWDLDTKLHVPEFGEPIVLYAQPAAGA